MAGEVTVHARKQRGSAMEGKGRAEGNWAAGQGGAVGEAGRSAGALLASQQRSDEPRLR